MDYRRLSTADVLMGGVLNTPAPVTDIPEDREEFDGEGDSWAYVGDEAVAAALDAGKLVKSSNYYGIPYAWKEAEGVYRGTLLQYRVVTENPTFSYVWAAAEWFGERYNATHG